jgi:hypothetical protein
MKTKPTKTAAKKTPKLTPIILTETTADILSWTSLAALLSQRSTSELKEDLRARSLSIPKTKEEMIDRLSVWARRNGGAFYLELR